jgi:hypothetical protein
MKLLSVNPSRGKLALILQMRNAQLFKIKAVINRVTNFYFPFYQTIQNLILPDIFYGRETWSLTLRKERRLRVSENWALRRICEPKRDEVTGELRRLHN